MDKETNSHFRAEAASSVPPLPLLWVSLFCLWPRVWSSSSSSSSSCVNISLLLWISRSFLSSRLIWQTFVSSSIKSYPPPPPPPPGVPALWLANSQQWCTDSPPFLPLSSGAFSSSSSVVFCICCCHTCVLSGVCDGQVFWFLWIIIQMRSGDQSGDCWCL